jgi:hypothetical protein
MFSEARASLRFVELQQGPVFHTFLFTSTAVPQTAMFARNFTNHLQLVK